HPFGLSLSKPRRMAQNGVFLSIRLGSAQRKETGMHPFRRLVYFSARPHAPQSPARRPGVAFHGTLAA
ncbi:MAG: hypothetical protein O9331_14105, partial [Acidovorax sp.]|nr:hypothetical protein [Acidovorax sp.]